MDYPMVWGDMKRWLEQGAEYMKVRKDELEERADVTKDYTEFNRVSGKLDGLKTCLSHMQNSERIYGIEDNNAPENYVDESNEDWAERKLDEIFLTEKFIEMGKADDLAFQSLVFLGKASAQLSYATTVLQDAGDIPEITKAELKDIQQRVHAIKTEIRGEE